MSGKHKLRREIIGPPGNQNELITVEDEKGKIVHHHISPLTISVKLKDILQIIVGASILAIPVGFTEETWHLAARLPFLNIFLFLLISILFISSFVYYNYYKGHLKEHKWEFIKRTLVTYGFAFLVVALLLSLIQLAPWGTDAALAFKRVILVTFPASMSAAVADTIK